MKTFGGEYNGPGLTRAEFEYARIEGSNYWLYVVERALTEEAKIYLIQSPAQQVNEFIFDDGWQALAGLNPSVEESTDA